MAVFLEAPSLQLSRELQQIAERWQLQHCPTAPLALVYSEIGLELRKRDEPKLTGVRVDFTSGPLAHRRRFGGGRAEAIARAVGIKGNYLPDVVDATAGLGRDAFVLAALGCRVRMIERHPVVAALLEDGLVRAGRDPEIGEWVKTRLSLLHGTSEQTLLSLEPRPDVVYLDPMYPHKQKSALVKKEMRLFQLLVGADQDADNLLNPARMVAKKRVVVKRPDYAPPLMEQVTSAAVVTKSHRFDIYPPWRQD
jgi:16S rRNA (guanine1516-N2)-methyltransferase